VGSVTIWSPFEANDFSNMLNDMYEHQSKGTVPYSADRYKMSYVSMHFENKYDKKGIWGVQVRALDSIQRTEALKGKSQIFLNAIQRRLESSDFGIPEEVLRDAFPDAPSELDNSLSKMMKEAKTNNQMWQLYYNKPWPDIFEEGKTRPVFNALLDKKGADNKYLKEILVGLTVPKPWGNQILTSNIDVKMLLHDWSKDPVIMAKNPVERTIIRARIESAQRWALAELTKSPELVRHIMQVFVSDAGLFELFDIH
jgi:hypothetical protein